MKRLSGISIALLFILSMFINIDNVSAKSTNVIPDSGLRKCLNQKYLHRSNTMQSITSTDLNTLNGKITTVDCNGFGIVNLSGIEYLSNLTTLMLSNNDLTDVSRITKLHKLKILNITSNHIIDLRPLRGIYYEKAFYGSWQKITEEQLGRMVKGDSFRIYGLEKTQVISLNDSNYQKSGYFEGEWHLESQYTGSYKIVPNRSVMPPSYLPNPLDPLSPIDDKIPNTGESSNNIGADDKSGDKNPILDNPALDKNSQDLEKDGQDLKEKGLIDGKLVQTGNQNYIFLVAVGAIALLFIKKFIKK